MENKKIKILLIEDSVDDAELIKRKLEKSAGARFQVAIATKLQDGLEQLAKNTPDLILSDLGLPDSHGLDTVTKILLAVPHIPLVVLSGFDDEAIAIKAVQSGAQDYLVKGQLEYSQLERSLFYSIERAHLQVELEQHTQEIFNVQANLQKILAKNADAIAVVGENGRILFANPAVEILLRRKQKDLLNRPFEFPLDGDGTSEIEIKGRGKDTIIAEMSVVKIRWEGSPAYLASLRNITKRKKMEEDLRTSEEKYRNIVELAQDGIITVDTRGFLTSCNQAFLHLLGISENEAVGRHFTKIPNINVIRNPQYLQMFASMLVGKVIRPIETEWKRRDGTSRMVELRCSLMKSDSSVTGIQVLVIDISERKKTEEFLRASEDKYRNIVEHANDGIFTMDTNGVFTSANQGFLNILGFPAEEIIGKNFSTVPALNTSDIPMYSKLFASSLSQKIIEPMELPFTHKGGARRTCEVRVSIMKSHSKIIGLQAIVIDNTERKHMENALKESEEKFSAAFRASPDIIAIADMKTGKCVEINDSYARATGYTREEIVGHPVNEIDMWVIPEESQKMMQLMQEQGQVRNEEFTFRIKSGEIRQWLCSAERINIGGDSCVMSVATDITERKQMEKAIQESEEKFSKAFRSSANSFAINKLKDGNFIEVNESFMSMTGYTREELIGHNATELNFWASEEEHERIVKKTRENEKVRNEQIKTRSKSGEIRTGLFSSEQITIGGEPCFINTITDITELKRAEESVRVSEEKFSKAFLRSPEVIIITNIEDGTIFEANDTFLRLTGYTREEVIGKKTVDLGIWAIPEQRAEAVKMLKEKGAVSNLECQFRMKSGKLRTWIFSAEIIHIDNKPRMLSVTTDITELKRAEEKLHESERKFRSIVENSSDRIFMLDKDCKFLSVNKAAADVFMKSPKEMLSISIFEVFPEDIAAQFSKNIKNVFDTGKNLLIEETVIAQGRAIAQSTSLNPVKDEKGSVTAVIGIARDITERKKMEDALRFSDTALKSIHEGIFALDSEFKITRWNEMCEQMFGIKASDVIGKSAADVITMAEAYPGQNEKRINLLLEKGFNREEQIYRTPRGDIWVDVQAQAMEENGKRYGWITLISDISERKKTEEALKQSEEKFRELINTSTDAIVSADPQMRVIIWNLGAEKMFGYTEKEMLAQSVLKIIPEKKLADGMNEFSQLSKGGASELSNKVVETIGLRKNGAEFPLEVSVSTRKTGDVYIITVIMRDISVRKEAEEALKQSEEKFRELINTSNDGITSADSNMKVILWNRGAEKMFGYTEKEMLGKSSLVIFPEAYKEPMTQWYAKLNTTGTSNETENQYVEVVGIRKDGTEVPVELSVSTRTVGDDYIVTAIIRDISIRKKAQEALKQSEEKYRELINTSPDGIISADSKMKIIIWNRSAEKIFGYSQEEMVGQSTLKMFPAASQIGIANWYAEFDKTGVSPIENQVFEAIGRKKDGSEFPIEVSISTRKSGDTLIATVIIRDISIRKKAQESLKQSEEKYRELINTSNDGIVSTDPQMRFILWNSGAEKLFGYTEEDMLGQSVMTIFSKTAQKDVARELVQIKKAGDSSFTNRVFETSVLKKDCSLVPVDISISTRKSGGKLIITAILRDITVRKEAEEKLKKIDQMKSEFLSNVSHELRTPLQSISGFTKLIMNGQVPDPATQQEFFQIIDRETMHLGNLINGLLDMSRLEAGRFQIFRKLVPIRDTFIDSFKMFQSLARDKNITLSEDIPPEIPDMEVDNERMRQVVVNLIGNAIKFSDPGSSINVKVEKRPGDLLFQVSDHGTGINEETMKHLFERFYRAEGETVRGGTGLGLYISKQIVDAHGGRIWAESKFGEGSTFSFTLPLNGKGGKENDKENPGH